MEEIINEKLKGIMKETIEVKTKKSMKETIEVKMKDRDKEIEMLRLALNVSGIYANYQQAELINNIVQKFNELKGNFTIDDGYDILMNWKKKWEEYEKQFEE